jgi:NAD-dependent dihydropyrimidine dehydrogenase PreA subunit
MAYVISDKCVDIKDMSCMAECPVDCIYEGDRAMYIHPGECVDCGACEPACPVEAISYHGDLDEDGRRFLTRAVEVFASVGSPGGASDHGPLGTDHPQIAAYPRTPAG